MSKRKTERLYKSTRREFARGLAALAATPVALPVVSAQQPRPDTPRPPQQTPPAEPPSPVAEALTEAANKRYPGFLSEEQLGLVKRSIDRTLRSADRLKLFDLSNGDEPAFTFTADLSADK